MQVTIKANANPETVSVGTDVLQILGGSSWTAATPQPQQVLLSVHNEGASPLYLKPVFNQTALTGLVSSTNRHFVLGPDQTESYWLAPGQQMVCVRATGTGDVSAYLVTVVV